MIAMDTHALDAIREHGRETYPEECCGALLGVAADGGVRVARLERMDNTRSEERRRRYSIDPLDYARVEREADAAGLQIVGFYHSHPDHPAVPSEYDREHGFPFFHYVLVAVRAGVPGDVASYVLSDDRRAFDREELKIEGPKE